MHIGESSSSVTSRWAAVLWVASYKQSWQSQYMWQQEILATVAYSLIGCSVKCLRDERAYIQVPHWDFGSSIYLVIGQALGRSNQSWMRRTKSSLFSLSLLPPNGRSQSAFWKKQIYSHCNKLTCTFSLQKGFWLWGLCTHLAIFVFSLFICEMLQYVFGVKDFTVKFIL